MYKNWVKAFLIVGFAGWSLLVGATSATVAGSDLLSGVEATVKPGTKGTVVVFLSAKCPCSNSHVAVLKELAQEFKEFHFVAVHANADEDLALSKPYFAKAELGFPVLEDRGSKLADEYKAARTPHAFVVSPEGKILYKGGVTSSNEASRADRQLLKDALNDVRAGRDVKVAEGRTLGCVISRGSHAW